MTRKFAGDRDYVVCKLEAIWWTDDPAPSGPIRRIAKRAVCWDAEKNIGGGLYRPRLGPRIFGRGLFWLDLYREAVCVSLHGAQSVD